MNAGDKKPPKRDQAESLLRFISRELKVNTIVSREGNDFFVLLEINGEIVGRRRLNKAKCCRSESPCIGTIPVSLEYQDKYGLPSFIHVSICYDEISDTFSRQAQTYPRTH